MMNTNLANVFLTIIELYACLHIIVFSSYFTYLDYKKAKGKFDRKQFLIENVVKPVVIMLAVVIVVELLKYLIFAL